jgi:hypothetical protein
MNTEPADDPQFLELVLVFQQTAWQALGKIQDPQTGTSEPQLPQAKHAIDMLAMLERKTAGNLTEAERGILSNALTQLRLNYVDVVSEQARKPASDPAAETSPEPPAGSGDETPEEPS